MSIIEALEKFNTIGEIAKEIKGYSNGRTNKEIKGYIIKYGYEKKFLQTSAEKYNNCPKKCKECDEIIPYNKRDNKFCSSNCSAKFNNKNRGNLPDNVKKKISLSLKIKQKNSYKEPKTYKKNCEFCEKEFIVERLDSGNLSRSKVCSDLCRFNLKSQKSKMKMKEIIKDGKHKGWQSRSILSYPEKFFIRVLKNENLFNFCETNKPYDGYFLDFYFEDLKIDLEIDGSQHKYRKEHDDKRDKYLISKGIKVYRIEWKSINTDKGKKYIKDEIDKFLNFYKKVKQEIKQL